MHASDAFTAQPSSDAPTCENADAQIIPITQIGANHDAHSAIVDASETPAALPKAGSGAHDVSVSAQKASATLIEARGDVHTAGADAQTSSATPSQAKGDTHDASADKQTVSTTLPEACRGVNDASEHTEEVLATLSVAHGATQDARVDAPATYTTKHTCAPRIPAQQTAADRRPPLLGQSPVRHNKQYWALDADLFAGAPAPSLLYPETLTTLNLQCNPLSLLLLLHM